MDEIIRAFVGGAVLLLLIMAAGTGWMLIATGQTLVLLAGIGFIILSWLIGRILLR